MSDQHAAVTTARASVRLLAALLATGTAAACSGPADVLIGADVVSTLFLSPDGADGNPGTVDRPWLTFQHAISNLGPGSTLVLLDGIYTRATTGYPDIRCGAGANNGTTDRPITLRADHERRAQLMGDAQGPPFFMTSCGHWVIEGLQASSDDFRATPETPEAGSVFVLGDDNHNVVLRRLLGRQPNRYRHSHVLRIGDGSSDILVEECELYDFHHNGFETSRTTAVVFRRNYVNARGTADLPDGYVSEDPIRGDFGFFLEETRFSTVENNIVESVRDGFGVVGRYPGLASDTPPPLENAIDGNRLLGNIVLHPTGNGFYLDSRCLGQNPCLDRGRLVAGTELIDNVVIGGAAGVRSAGAIGTRVSQVSVIGAMAGVVMGRDAQNVGIAAGSSTSNTLVLGASGAAFSSTGETDWSFDHCATSAGTGPAFVPDDAHVTAPLAVDPALGACLVYLPAGSPLRRMGIGARDVGANVLARYENSLLTPALLWDPATGAFPCGATQAGVSDDATRACRGVHQRLSVASAGCPLP